MSQVIVSIASWPPRIKYVETCVRSLLGQTRKPNLIELHLSRQEFPFGIDSLPDGLLRLIAAREITLHWEKGNTGPFRKETGPARLHQGEDYLLFPADDDAIYSPGYIERMLEKLGDDDVYCFEPGYIGYRSVIRGRVLKPLLWERLTPEIVATGINDTWVAHYLTKVGARCRWERDRELSGMVGANGDAPVDHPNSERVGGYTTERFLLANRLSKEALGL